MSDCLLKRDRGSSVRFLPGRTSIPEIAPLFKAENAILSFYASTDGKISREKSGLWEARPFDKMRGPGHVNVFWPDVLPAL